MPSWKVWVQRPCGIIESGRKHKHFLRESGLMKVDNVLQKCISTINLNYYWIGTITLSKTSFNNLPLKSILMLLQLLKCDTNAVCFKFIPLILLICLPFQSCHLLVLSRSKKSALFHCTTTMEYHISHSSNYNYQRAALKRLTRLDFFN